MICKKWSESTPASLLGMSTISFIKSSEVFVIIIFNETISWQESSETMYTFTISSRRLLLKSTLKYLQISEQELKLSVESLPYSGELSLPAHYVVSSITNYPLQNPTTTVILP